ncbi:Serine/threonine-protein kinase pkn1 [Aquisphaera giovannonii]|uniref:Serine/threonine-protein kinase pkn1 n=1 Tax=Aquisphaera giovannonii TaxID=406548 RepID=A0A5B9WCR1_9BACT|nr:formylglycine-generating enzyme family protein [Aquisphaera giovannonii]QEH38396.1 Serine/threonine-protein kinase pkn1 [Aquisphaera giovannonii]
MPGRALLGVLIVGGMANLASAQDPVEFDARRLFSCAEVKPPQQADSARRVIVVVIPVSANFNAEESTIESLRYELRLPKTVTVLDHLPKTQTGTSVVGPQHEQRQEHRVTDLNVEYGGGGRIGFKVFGVGVEAGGGGSKTERDYNEVKTNIQVDRLPAHDQIVVAGTRDEGQTLYFDLKWHDQTTRAGQTDYAILAEVPRDWTGDVATLACVARQGGAAAGRMTKVIGLYLSGDNSARQRVETLLETARPTASATERELISNSIGMKMRLIPAGPFLMGATGESQAYADEKPQHRVTITRPFYLGVYEVTQYEYRQVMGENPSRFNDSELLPVEQVSWLDAVCFCNKLSERESRRPYYKIEGDAVTIQGGSGYRLPTEAEWEYACRAPRNSEEAMKHPFGGDDSALEQYAWFDGNSEKKTHPVGQKKPNRWGLYDMQGNVWEWCQDRYSDVYYRFSPDADPAGPSEAPYRVIRGGSWCYDPWLCRPAYRLRDTPDNRSNALGFRVAAVQE